MTGDVLMLRPWWLLAIPLLAAAGFWVWRRRRAGAWAALLAPEVRAKLQEMGRFAPGGRDLAVLAPLAAAALTALALSGPARLRLSETSYERVDPILIAFDLSPSVARSENLADAQAAAAWILSRAEGRPIGLILYAADAYLASAPTTDAATLETLIGALGPDTMPVTGSRPDFALNQARALFGEAGAATRPGLLGADIIFISDGAGIGLHAEEEAARLKAEGARVWALGLDRPPPEGAPPADPEALRRLAAAGGGAFAPARDPGAAMEAISRARRGVLARSPLAPQAFEDFGRWILLAALPFALILFRREAPIRRTGGAS
ncbi:vWA domain-containing protein [Neomegalonema perideroedes]|uniref:VWA domain-containing protein n=1 Tax=Neomegalonema perideroedes TaxID=217219 RepID=UPI0003651AAC|nr:VWA domain-containing protein [Neomegalonema perideroedes]